MAYSILTHKGIRRAMNPSDPQTGDEATSIAYAQQVANQTGMPVWVEYWYDEAVFRSYWHVTRRWTVYPTTAYDASNHGFNERNFEVMQAGLHGYSDAHARSDRTNPFYTPRSAQPEVPIENRPRHG